MKRRLEWLVWSVGAALFWLGSAAAETVDKLPAPTSYVSDFAGVIDSASKQQMEQLCAEVDHQAHAQIAVVTIHTLEGDTAANFANRLEEKWKVGAKGTDHGVLMLFSIDDRQRWIEVGYGLEGVLNDAKVGDIGRTMRPQLQAGQYGPAIYGGLRQVAGDIATDAGVTLTTPASRSRPVQQRGSNGGSILRFLVIAAIVIFFLSRRGGRGGRGGYGGGGGGFLPGLLLGNLLGGGRGGGGGFSGGGDGGGDSGGNGDGGFGGFDGGSSGGGGAGGDW